MPGPGGGPGGPGGGRNPRNFLTPEEKKNKPKVTFALVKRVFSYLKPYWIQLILVFIAILAASIVGVFPSIITGRIVDEALTGRNLSLLIRLLLYAFAALLGSQLISLLESYVNVWISQKIIYDMRNQMYNHLQYMPHAFFTTEKQGDIITRMNSDISGVSGVITDTLTSIISNIATVITTLFALFSLSWKLAIVGLIMLPLMIIPSRVVGKTRWQILSKGQKKTDEMNEMINETLSVSGSMLVKLFTKEEREYERFRSINNEVTRYSLKEQRSGQWFRMAMGMMMQIPPLLIYFAGGYFIITNWDSALTIGTVTATVTLINRLYRPVEQLLNIHVQFTRSMALFTRIFDFFDRKNDLVSPENGSRPDVTDPDIVFDHVSFSYNPEVPVLKDISFSVTGGQMVAVVGRSGSGKSTLVNLIPRLYDVTSGCVSVCGCDVRDYDLKYLREQIGVVTQDTYLFNGSIMDNLKFANEDATQEDIIKACQAANIHDFIASLPEGYDTVVGNRGLKLSGGEKQRLSIARVLLKDPRILILDEATSSLDSISENVIQDALERVMVGRTNIVIAHRLTTILKADDILVIKDGQIAEHGKHDDLLKLNGVYRELYETQFRKVLEHEGLTADHPA